MFTSVFFITRMLEVKYAMPSVVAGALFGSINLVAAILLPVIGSIVDKYGGITFFMTLSSIIAFLVNFLWLAIPYEQCSASKSCFNYVIFPIILNGVSYSMCSGAGWNGVWYLVERSKCGKAAGLQLTILNFGLMNTQPLFGYLVDNSLDRDKGYRDPILMTLAFSFVSIILNMANQFYDKMYNDGMLAASVKRRNQIVQERSKKND